VFHKIANPIIKKISLILLKKRAFKLDNNVKFLNFQKLISKNDVKPISSQPKINENMLLLKTKKIIENINQFISKIKSSDLSSYLK